MEQLIKQVNALVSDELSRASKIRGALHHSAHEAYAVILEERDDGIKEVSELDKCLDEYWFGITCNSTEQQGEALRKVEELAVHAACEYILANCAGMGHTEMAERLNGLFGTEYTASQIKGYYGNHKLSSGVTGHFRKGHVPYNKGRKGICATGCEKGWFKKGRMPQTHKPVGTESFRPSDGYWWVKVAEPNKWREKHVLVWEAAHGKRPDGHVITFLDGNRSNFDLDNLKLITLAEHAIMSHEGYRSSNAEFTETGILLARVKMAKTAAKKKVKRKRRKKGLSNE